MNPGDLERCSAEAAIAELEISAECFPECVADDVGIVAKRIISGDLVLNKSQGETFARIVKDLVTRVQA